MAINSLLFLTPLYKTNGIKGIIGKQNKSETINIISSNVYTANNNYKTAIDLFYSNNPDLIVLTETDENWIKNLIPLEGRYQYRLAHPRSDNFGMAIYSRLPFDAKIIEIGNYKLPLAILDFEKFRLILAHPIPPISFESFEENKLYINAIAEYSKMSKKPVIIAGDLNATLWGGAIKPLIAADLKRINLYGIAYTWPTHFSLLAMQIDHFFARGIKEANFKVLPSIGSDHFPIQAIVKLN